MSTPPVHKPHAAPADPTPRPEPGARPVDTDALEPRPAPADDNALESLGRAVAQPVRDAAEVGERRQKGKP